MILKNARNRNDFLAVGTGFQQELEEVLVSIWNNQQFLDYKDLEDLRKFGE